jgi:virginiamycin A acetyltransferase
MSLWKSIAYLFAIIAVSPVIAWFYFVSPICGKDPTLEGASQLISLVPGRLGVWMRAAFYSNVLNQCHRNVVIGFGSLFSKVDSRIGSHVYIGPYSQLGCVTIGDNTLIGPQVQISGPNVHTFERLDVPIRNQPRKMERIEIGEDCWIGAGAIVMAQVGSQSVVGAGSVVTRPIPNRSVAIGTPARVLKERT